MDNELKEYAEIYFPGLPIYGKYGETIRKTTHFQFWVLDKRISDLISAMKEALVLRLG